MNLSEEEKQFCMDKTRDEDRDRQDCCHSMAHPWTVE